MLKLADGQLNDHILAQKDFFVYNCTSHIKQQ